MTTRMRMTTTGGPSRFTRWDAMGVRFADGDPAGQEGAAGETAQQEPPTPAPQTPPAAGREQLPNGEHGYPPDTPTAEMTTEQELAYWKHRSRGHEDKWKQVVNRNLTPDQVIEMQQQLDEANRARMTDHQREVADARSAGEEEARKALMPQVVRQSIAAALARTAPVITDAEIQARTEFLDLTKFLTNKGEVDTDKVTNYAATLAPTAGGADSGSKKFPDMGGGKRGPVTETAKARADKVARERGWVRD